MGAAAYGVASGQDGRAARCALRLDVEVEQAHALGGQLVDPRRRRAPEHSATIDANFPVTEVVHEDEDNVGLLVRGLSESRLRRKQCCNRENETQQK